MRVIILISECKAAIKRTDGAASTESSSLELCRVVTEVDDYQWQKRACSHFAEREQAHRWLNLFWRVENENSFFSFLRTCFSFPSAKVRTICEVVGESRESDVIFSKNATFVSKPSAKVSIFFEVFEKGFQSCFTFLFLETLLDSSILSILSIVNFIGFLTKWKTLTLYNGKVLLSFVII